MSLPLLKAVQERSLLGDAIESDCRYFEMGAELDQLDGATLAWMPGLASSPAAAVIHRVDPKAIVGPSWVARAEASMMAIGATMARIYLGEPQQRADALLRSCGYTPRDELIFLDSLGDPTFDLTLRPVEAESDWLEKLRFHQAADRTPDGHGNPAAQWVELERRKCRAGMETFLAELNGELVGAVGAIWCDNFIRAKNLVVAPDRRRRGIGRSMVESLAALGRRRGVSKQCFLAVRGEQGELLYRALGMAMIGYQVEWSKPIGGGAK